jgi:hypothetical protein
LIRRVRTAGEQRPIFGENGTLSWRLRRLLVAAASGFTLRCDGSEMPPRPTASPQGAVFFIDFIAHTIESSFTRRLWRDTRWQIRNLIPCSTASPGKIGWRSRD